MAFSKGQQGEYRALVKEAWEKHCRRNGADAKDKAALDLWTRGHLETATGRRSTKDCDGGRQWERACAHFEALTESGIRYQLILVNGDMRRIRFAIQRVCPRFLAQFAGDQALHQWLRGIAQQALVLPQPPELHSLDDTEIATVTQIARTAAHRFAKAA